MGDDNKTSGEHARRPLSVLWIDPNALMRKTLELVAEEVADDLTIVATIAEARRALARGQRFDWIVCEQYEPGSACEDFLAELAAEGRRVAITGSDLGAGVPPGARVFGTFVALPELLEELRVAEERLDETGGQ
jgi:CheY-like chemotaxis protein